MNKHHERLIRGAFEVVMALIALRRLRRNRLERSQKRPVRPAHPRSKQSPGKPVRGPMRPRTLPAPRRSAIHREAERQLRAIEDGHEAARGWYG